MNRKLVIFALLFAGWAFALWAARKIPAPAPVPLFAETLDRATLDNVAIAPPAEALTFARFLRDGIVHLLRVESYAGGKVTGIDLTSTWPGTRDPITLLSEHDYDEIAKATGSDETVAAADLQIPFDGTDAQIAMGVNYPEHGREVKVAQGFVFPKMTRATGPRASVPAQGCMFDYEVELGIVALAPIRADAPPQLGFVLASDYTDRATLLRHINLFDVPSGDGFTQGKSGAGLMPVGDLFVVPKDALSFYKPLQLELWLNGAKRQHADPAQMSWDIPRMIAESFARADRTWQWNDGTAALPIRDGIIPERTLILSGTPAGAIFQAPGPVMLFVGISETLFSLQWLRPNNILEHYIQRECASGDFLKAGDEVVMRADRLGVIVNRIGGGDGG
jgi:2,4-diketo-3-deoxy-L-fuconate hydrolase